jgi:2-hydroxy-3-keto-5-methylthiopentenyl-1-phosphate phosphatase
LKPAPGMLFVVDFDGTIAPVDTVDALLERFADPEWRRIETKWVKGEIDSRQCMAAQIALVRGADRLLERFLSSVEIDPDFAAFVDHVREFAEVAIVSDGLDYPIARALQKLGLSIPFFANSLSFHPRGLDLSFPYSDSACAVGSGVCKCAAARRIDSGNGRPWVLIGDGRSDICIAQSADYVFAKGTLRRFCESEGISHSPFETFADVLAVVREWDGQRFEEAPVRRVNVR